MLYRIRIGEDEYIGNAAEVIAFMARAEGAPGSDPRTYMEGVATRLQEKLRVEGIRTDAPEAFLDSLDEHGVVQVEIFPEPSDERVPKDEALGDGLIGLGEDVDPDVLDG